MQNTVHENEDIEEDKVSFFCRKKSFSVFLLGITILDPQNTVKETGEENVATHQSSKAYFDNIHELNKRK